MSSPIYSVAPLIKTAKLSGRTFTIPLVFVQERLEAWQLWLNRFWWQKKINNFYNSTFQVDSNNIFAFIANQFCRGLFFSGVQVRPLWSKTFGIEIVKNIMSKRKFLKIMKFLRFDDKNTRDVQKMSTNLQPFEILMQFDVLLATRLLPNKSRSPITQYIPTKPDKFGIQFWMLVDVESKYICNAFLYCGKHDLFYNDTKCFQGEYVM